MEGSALPGVLINGRDSAGGKFNKAMGENGAAVSLGNSMLIGVCVPKI